MAGGCEAEEAAVVAAQEEVEETGEAFKTAQAVLAAAEEALKKCRGT